MERSPKLLRQEISGRVSGNLARLVERNPSALRNARIRKASEFLKKLDAGHYDSKLAKIEPWKVNPHLLQVSWKWSSPEIKEWSAERAKLFGIKPRQFFAGVLETVRRIQWDVARSLAREKDWRYGGLPYVLVHNALDLHPVLHSFNESFKTSKLINRNFLELPVHEKSKAEGFFLDAAHSALTAGHTSGMQLGHAIALDDNRVMAAFDAVLPKLAKKKAYGTHLLSEPEYLYDAWDSMMGYDYSGIPFDRAKKLHDELFKAGKRQGIMGYEHASWLSLVELVAHETYHFYEPEGQETARLERARELHGRQAPPKKGEPPRHLNYYRAEVEQKEEVCSFDQKFRDRSRIFPRPLNYLQPFFKAIKSAQKH
ncbi:MAG: hypothetical protein WC792_00225 [Candidatus Micrarchaeia archaeon]|jgi:hypothetical protein